MLVSELIRKKREGRKLSRAEIEGLVLGYSRGDIPDYQFSAFLMATFLKGLDQKETLHLTGAMLNSGQKIDLSSVAGPKIDKHSTGGVGDKVSLILAPLAAACGVKVPMLSGRGLGHTGGTIDKLESIPGFRSRLSPDEFKTNLEKVGLGIMSQSDQIAPADKKIYALRGVTATVDYIPFITASILSKKLAEGAEGVVYDVKTGEGAFMKTVYHSKKLARSLISVSRKMGQKSVALITDMSEPLGEAVGNSLEIIESIEALKGNWNKDLKQVTYYLGAEMLMMAEVCQDYRSAFRFLAEVNANGTALNKFKEMIRAQGGEVRVTEDYTIFPQARYRVPVRAEREGYLSKILTEKIGFLAVTIGGGRKKKEDKIDHSAGFLIKKKIGEKVKKGEMLAEIFANELAGAKEVEQESKSCFLITREKTKRVKKILFRIEANSIFPVREIEVCRPAGI